MAFKPSYTDPALDNFIAVSVARTILNTTLEDRALGITDADAAHIRRAVDETLAGEVTVERSDVMRGVGRALTEMGQTGSISAEQAARLRIAAAAALVLPAAGRHRDRGAPHRAGRAELDRFARSLEP